MALWDIEAEAEAEAKAASTREPGDPATVSGGKFFTNSLGAGGRQAEEDLAAVIRAKLRAGDHETAAAAPAAAAAPSPAAAVPGGMPATGDAVTEAEQASAGSSAQSAPRSAAAAPSKAQQRLADLRARLGKGRRDNGKETYWEARRAAGAADASGFAGRAAPGKRDRGSAAGSAGGSGPGDATGLLDEDATGAIAAASKRQRQKDREAAGHFGWDQYNADKARAEYRRDVAAVAPAARIGVRASESAVARAEAVIPQMAGAARHGAADYADSGAVAAVAARVEEKISSGVGRVRKVKQDEAPTYINDRNRRMNQNLEKHYGKFVAETKEDIERGTAL
jgi:hypothetical protein